MAHDAGIVYSSRKAGLFDVVSMKLQKAWGSKPLPVSIVALRDGRRVLKKVPLQAEM